MKFFSFLVFFSKALDKRWKDLNLVFDENALFGFYGHSKSFRFGDLSIFFKNFEFFKANNIYSLHLVHR
jgi:hypothetical protein